MLKLRSLVAVVTGSVANVVSNLLTFGKRSTLHAFNASIAFDGRVAVSCFLHFSCQRLSSEQVTILLSTSH